MKICAVFPGQGFQRFGMLANLAQRFPEVVEPIVGKCDEVLPTLELSRILLGHGEPVDPTPTELAQPLLLAQGYAYFRAWEITNPGSSCKYGMGHSLGEFTALVSAGILDFESGLKLVRARGKAMRDATKNSSEQYGMTMVMKPRQFADSWFSLLEQCSSKSQVDIAAFNSSSQTVVSGSQTDLAKFVDLLKSEAKTTRIVTKKLPVSSAFHSRYMKPAAQKLYSLVNDVHWAFDRRKFDVVTNVTGLPYTSADEIRENLVSALTNPVKWVQSYEFVDNSDIDAYVSMGGEIGKLMEKEAKKESVSFP